MKANDYKLFISFSFLSFVFLLISAFAISNVSAKSAPDSFAPLVEKLSPAVVNISTSQKIKQKQFGGQMFGMPNMPKHQQELFKDFFEQFGGMQGGKPLEREVHALGSGFIISKDGYVVTNSHVIKDAEEIKVILSNDLKLSAKLIGHDPKTDIALLKIESAEDLPFVEFGNSDVARVGDWVIAIGNPFGLGGTVSAGIISARSRNINAGPFDDFLQTDAAINRGNSGGPMFNLAGDVIGVNTAIFSPTGGNVGIGFAVPAALVEPVVKQLKQYGRTHRGWLGVKIQYVTEEVADSLGLSKASGALVIEVNADGPAKKAGIKSGDVILSFDDKPVEEMRFLPRIVAETKIGKRANISVWRDGKKKNLIVTLGELDEGNKVEKAENKSDSQSKASPDGEKYLGMVLKKLNSETRKFLSIDAAIKKGVVVLQIDRSGLAVKRGFSVGDVILGVVNQDDISSVSEFKLAIARLKKSGRKFALVRVLRNGEVSLLTLPTTE